MSRYLIAANLKRQALAAALARTVKEQSQLAAGFVQQHFNTLSGNRHGGTGGREVDDEDVDALIAASLQELGADALPAENANLDELDDFAIDGDEGEEGVEDDPNAEILRRRRSMQQRAASKLAARKAAQGQYAAGVTAPMQVLNDLALKRARAMIVKRFASSLDLDESSSVAQTLQRQATASASQLNGAVQTKLDALKRAADLMEESSSRLSRLSGTMKDIDARIAQTNTTIRNFENLRRVSYARDNLQRVLSQIDFFTKVRVRIRVTPAALSTYLPTYIPHTSTRRCRAQPS